MEEVVVPDTSALIEGKLKEALKAMEGRRVRVAVPLAALDELQAQASKGRESGWMGLKELIRLRKLCEKKGVSLSFMGERPSMEDIKLANSGRIDALIIDVARRMGGVLYTADQVQARVAEAEGVAVKLIRRRIRRKRLEFEKFFTADTLSLHLKEGVPPLAKRGLPGKFSLVKLRDTPSTLNELERYIKEIFDAAKADRNSFTELSMRGAMIIQLGRYRIAVARPPFSDGVELTIVRPTVELKLEDYELSSRLMMRLRERAEGILIAGPPGSGKTTFASSLAEFYSKQGKIIKTLESPRDLQVGPQITQYSPLEGSFEKTADILLLVRPDYSIFDEIRKTPDFKVFADLRSAGVGMIGVVHASNPIDAIQRFMARLELGLIPQTIDTVIFIKYGRVEQVLTVSLTVKVPTGMVEAELARPVVELKNFETNELEYEIYTFGEENVVVPIKGETPPSPAERLAIQKIKEEISRFDPEAEVRLLNPSRALIKVREEAVPSIIGKSGSTISRLEEKLGISLEVEAKGEAEHPTLPYRLKELKNRWELVIDKRHAGNMINLQVEGKTVGRFKVNRKGKVTVPTRSEEGKKLEEALKKGYDIKVSRIS